jgi:hypothetical protein
LTARICLLLALIRESGKLALILDSLDWFRSVHRSCAVLDRYKCGAHAVFDGDQLTGEFPMSLLSTGRTALLLPKLMGTRADALFQVYHAGPFRCRFAMDKHIVLNGFQVGALAVLLGRCPAMMGQFFLRKVLSRRNDPDRL